MVAKWPSQKDAADQHHPWTIKTVLVVASFGCLFVRHKTCLTELTASAQAPQQDVPLAVWSSRDLAAELSKPCCMQGGAIKQKLLVDTRVQVCPLRRRPHGHRRQRLASQLGFAAAVGHPGAGALDSKHSLASRRLVPGWIIQNQASNFSTLTLNGAQLDCLVEIWNCMMPVLGKAWAQLLAQARDALEIVAGQNDVEVLVHAEAALQLPALARLHSAFAWAPTTSP
mmetsp:Transcript_1580/g.3649  ORF Transcript_1580/g.3649 Transcript_1580/m.3649 type:complete len:227 (-) Transcript_1580:612-1292(-)